MRNIPLALSMIPAISLPAFGEPAAAPFVAGFDRFYQDADGDATQGGLLLLSELSCTACHAADDDPLQPKRGPRLEGAGLRLQREWLGRFLSDPQSVKPGTTMPDVLHGVPTEEKDDTIRALLAFLSTQRAPLPVVDSTASMPVAREFWNKGDPEQGRQLYHQVGCVACHEPHKHYKSATRRDSQVEKLLAQTDPDSVGETGISGAAPPVRSVPHGRLAAKYTRKSLTFFLFDPERVRPAGRMPGLKLRPDEAAHIARFLLNDQPGNARSIAEVEGADLIRKGRDFFHTLGCVNCHSATRINAPRPAKRLTELDWTAENSCLAAPSSGQPKFHLSEVQRRAILQTIAAEAGRLPVLEFRMLQLNCYACHKRNRRGGVDTARRRYFVTAGHVDLGDEGRIPPPLDSVGGKLTQDWLKQVLSGTGDVRPYMLARMPKFGGESVVSLPGAFAEADGGIRQLSASEVFGDTQALAAAGLTLMDTGCVQCHPFRGEHLPGVVGIDLAGIPDRIHPKWLHDFLLNPARLKPRTRMPTFFPNGRSANRRVLDGNVERQLAAMWACLKEIDRQPLPKKIVQGNAYNFELVPKDRPILLRTFMKQAGTHAIAVGFPEKVHVSFDAEQVRVAQAWRGRFIDAHGTWFDRFTPPAEPLGTDVIAMPPGVPFALLSDDRDRWPPATGEEAGYRLGGYRLDLSGVPTFLYTFDRVDIEDRFEPAAGKALKRRLVIRDRRGEAIQPAQIWFRANAGRHIRRNRAYSYTNDQGLTTIVSNDVGHPGKLRSVGGVTEWNIPLEVNHEKVFEVHYQW